MKKKICNTENKCLQNIMFSGNRKKFKNNLKDKEKKIKQEMVVVIIVCLPAMQDYLPKKAAPSPSVVRRQVMSYDCSLLRFQLTIKQLPARQWTHDQ